MPLDEARHKFIDRYIETGEKQQSAIDAGYSARSAATTANRLLKDPDVQAEIARRRAKIEAIADLDTAQVIEELKALIFFNPKDLLKDDGSPMPIKELPDKVAKAIAGMDIQEVWEDKQFIGYVKKYRLTSKLDAIDKALRILGKYQDKSETEHTGEIKVTVRRMGTTGKD